jgi:hypothetical protein
MSNVIKLDRAVKIPGSDNAISEVCRITPAIATAWLRANRINRPIRKRHVNYLADEILSGNWRVNGEPIIIGEDENILNGQHRLLAIIEAGQPIETFVTYGIKEEAFLTMDTGAVRSGADAMCLKFREHTISAVKAVATSVPWVMLLERGQLLRGGRRVSNTDIVEYAKEHDSLFARAETLLHYPKDNRPLSVGVGTALFEMFARKDEEKAEKFMLDLYTGENLQRHDVEYVLRHAFAKDAQRNTKLPIHVKVRMVIKGWNWRRRGMPQATHQTITVSANEDQRITIL